MTFKLDAHDQAIVDAVRRHSLRHPGVVAKRIAGLVRPDGGTITMEQLADIKLEYLKLGLGSTGGG